MTQDEIRLLYIEQLWAELERLQAETDDMNAPYYAEHPEHVNDPVLGRCTEFMCDLFDAGECEWAFANEFRFYCPDGFSIDARTLDVIGKPDVCWSLPSVEIVDGRLCVSVMTACDD